MEEAPAPFTSGISSETPQSIDHEHKRNFKALYKENIYYEISIYKKNFEFIIEAEITKDSDNIKYSNHYNLDTLKKFNKFLSLCESIDDIIDTIFENVSNNNCTIKEYNNNYQIKIPVPVKNINEIIFVLKEQQKTKEEIINDLIKSSKMLKQKNIEFESRVKQLEEENKNIKNELKELKILFSELKLEKGKNNIEEINPIINGESKLINYPMFIKINNWINQRKSLNFQLIFSALINGDKAENVHKNCDGKGPTVTIIKSKNGHIFGSYLTIPFSSDDKPHYDEKAFLFSLTNNKKFNIKIKEKAVCHYLKWGPYIGYPEKCDLAIAQGCLKNFRSYCEPHSYEFNRIDLIGSTDKYFGIEEYEIYLIY